MSEKEEDKGKFTTKGVYKCLTAIQDAIKMMDEACGDYSGALKSALGLEEEDVSKPSSYCEEILKPEWLTKKTCYDFKEIRRYVMCLTWKKIEDEHLRFKDAISQAWDEAKAKCSEKGAYI